VIEIETPRGLAYAQYTHEHRDPPRLGSLLRVLPARPDDVRAKTAFTDDMGVLLEDYVLRQARQMPLEALLPAIEYEPGKHSTDLILI
jgi:hypothetical protein